MANSFFIERRLLMINDRIREIRDYYNMSQRDFAKMIDVGASTLAMFETGDRKPKEIHINRICSECNINKSWLVDGIGDKFVTPVDETAEYVSMFLEESNPFFDLILETMRSYAKLDRAGKEALYKMSADIIENIQKKGSD